MGSIQTILKQNKAIVIILFLSLLVVISLPFITGKTVTVSVPQQAKSAQKVPSDIVYAGKSGMDALTLLKAKESVSQDKSGLVTAIAGRKADSSQHDYWAFYVNGKMAQVGPADYKTKDGDTIEWKIAKY